MKRFTLYFASLTALLVLSSAVASADTLLQYTIAGPSGYTASWTLPENPTVLTFVPDAGPATAIGQGYFEAQASNFTINGSTPDNQGLDFFLADQGGGMLTDPNFSALNFYGPQLFSGSLDSPTMLTSGSNPFSLDIGDDTFAYTLTVSPVVSTPEPSAFLLLGLGLAALFLMRRRRAAA